MNLHLIIPKGIMPAYMYSIEGEITTKINPETLIGKYGLFYESRSTNVAKQGTEARKDNLVWVTGAEWLVKRSAAKLRKQGIVPEGIGVEHILSQEQAEKYPTVKTKSFSIGKFRKPELKTVLDDFILPDGEKLVKGFANLWRELRVPSPYIYCLATAELLGRMEYSHSYGWGNQRREEDGGESQFSVRGSRVKIGFVTPIFSITKANINTETTTYSRHY